MELHAAKGEEEAGGRQGDVRRRVISEIYGVGAADIGSGVISFCSVKHFFKRKYAYYCS